MKNQLEIVCNMDPAQKEQLCEAIKTAAYLKKPFLKASVGVWGLGENNLYPEEAISRSCQIISLRKAHPGSLDRAVIYFPKDELFSKDRRAPFVWAFRNLKPSAHMAVAAFIHPEKHHYGHWLEPICSAGFDAWVLEKLRSITPNLVIITAYKR